MNIIFKNTCLNFFKTLKKNSFVYEYNNKDKKNVTINYLRKIELPRPINEGWGITTYNPSNNSESLIISDGTDNLYFVTPDVNMTKIEITHTIQVFF